MTKSTRIQATKPVEEVTDFYDAFLDRRMIRYRIEGSPRIERAADLVAGLVRASDRVADIGCGIGMAAERISRAEPQARILAVDLSPKNVAFARASVTASNIEFDVLDVNADRERLRAFAPDGFQVMAMLDVIEHIAPEERPALLASLAALAAPGGWLVLTYPTPEFQDLLEREDPDELQILDEKIPASTLLAEAEAAGWALRRFAYVDIDHTEQYVHVVLRKADGTPSPTVLHRPGGLRGRIERNLARIFLHPARRRRYLRLADAAHK